MGFDGILPDEIILDIFSRISVSYAAQFQSACRTWSKEEYIKAYNARKASLPLVVFRDKDGAPSADNGFVHYGDSSLASFNLLAGGERRQPITFDNRFHQLHYSCEGLLLLMIKSSGEYILCNPATRQSLKLKALKRSTVVALYSPDGGQEFRVLFGSGRIHYVLTIGSTEPHRSVKVPPGSHGQFPAILFKGSIHWILVRVGSHKLIVFDTMKECCTEMSCPATDISARLFQFKDDTLGISEENMELTEISIWMVQDYLKGVWQLKWKVGLNSLEIRLSDDHIVVSEKGDLLVCAPGCLFHIDSKGNVINEFTCQNYDPIGVGHWFNESIARHSLFTSIAFLQDSPFFKGM